MELKHLNNQQIISGLQQLVKTERKITHEILCHIAMIERRKIYAELGYESTLAYLIKACRYSEGAAYRRREAARLLIQIPDLATPLQNGSLNLSQLTQVRTCLKQEKKIALTDHRVQTKELLQSLENKNGFETKKILAIEFNQPIVTIEKVQPQQDDSVRMELTFSREQIEILRKAKDLMSHACPDQNWTTVITQLARAEIRKREGRSTRVNSRSAKIVEDKFQAIAQSKTAAGVSEDRNESVAPEPEKISHAGTQKTKNPKTRKYISVKIRRKVFLAAQHKCEYRDPVKGTSCDSKYKLEIDHVVPLACGGEDTENNYRVLCQTHNLSEARKWGLGR